MASRYIRAVVCLVIVAATTTAQQIDHSQINDAHLVENGQNNYALTSPGLDQTGWKTASVNANILFAYTAQCLPIVKLLNFMTVQEKSALEEAKNRLSQAKQSGVSNNNGNLNINTTPNSNVNIGNMKLNGNIEIGDTTGSNVNIASHGITNINSNNGHTTSGINQNNGRSIRFGNIQIGDTTGSNVNIANHGITSINSNNGQNINAINNNGRSIHYGNIQIGDTTGSNVNIANHGLARINDQIYGTNLNANINGNAESNNIENFYNQQVYKSGWSTYPLLGGPQSMTVAKNINVSNFEYNGSSITKYDDENISMSRPDLFNNIARVFVHKDAATFAFKDGQVVIVPMNCLDPLGVMVVQRARQEAQAGSQQFSQSGGLWRF